MKIKKKPLSLVFIWLLIIVTSSVVSSVIVVKNGFPYITVLAIQVVSISVGMYYSYIHGQLTGTGKAIPVDKIEAGVQMGVVSCHKKIYPSNINYVLAQPKYRYSNEDLEKKKIQPVVLIEIPEEHLGLEILEDGDTIWVDNNGVVQLVQRQQETEI